MILSEILNAVKKIKGESENARSFLDLKKAYNSGDYLENQEALDAFLDLKKAYKLGDDFLKKEINKAIASR